MLLMCIYSVLRLFAGWIHSTGGRAVEWSCVELIIFEKEQDKEPRRGVPGLELGHWSMTIVYGDHSKSVSQVKINSFFQGKIVDPSRGDPEDRLQITEVPPLWLNPNHNFTQLLYPPGTPLAGSSRFKWRQGRQLNLPCGDLRSQKGS
ncbi:hypothetical protein BDN72DRAFT_853501 [Pluteus cervinus]|uniref:Uncharacterized protein n=1 Tax=Pluteus cervinus TaxID=181527 RepID=A0ACD3BBQ0_9AGAR|nr:hypothetical protein BDN72DRAFT_853501 [Pluteus cervinus]